MVVLVCWCGISYHTSASDVSEPESLHGHERIQLRFTFSCCVCVSSVHRRLFTVFNVMPAIQDRVKRMCLTFYALCTQFVHIHIHTHTQTNTCIH